MLTSLKSVRDNDGAFFAGAKEDFESERVGETERERDYFT